MAGQPQGGPAGLRSEPEIRFAEIAKVPNFPNTRCIQLPNGAAYYLELGRRIDMDGKAFIWMARLCDLTKNTVAFAPQTAQATHIVKLESKRTRKLDDPLIHIRVATHLQRTEVNEFGHPGLLCMPVQCDEAVGTVMPLYDASLFEYCGKVAPAGRPPLNLERLLVDWVLHLHVMHREGLVHSDVSPDNMMIALQGQRALLIDFGTTVEQVAPSGLGMEDRFFGKPGYRAPEGFDQHVNRATSATDIWCLGASVLHFLSKDTFEIGRRGWCTHRTDPQQGAPPAHLAWPVALRVPGQTPGAFTQRMQKLVDAEITHRCAAQPWQAMDFVRRCLRVDPDQRPTACQLLAHSYISDVVDHAAHGAGLAAEESPRLEARHARLLAIAAMRPAEVPLYPAVWSGETFRPPPQAAAAAPAAGGRLRIALPPRPGPLAAIGANVQAGGVAGSPGEAAGSREAEMAEARAGEPAAAGGGAAPLAVAPILSDPHEDSDSEDEDEPMDGMDDII